MSESSGLTLEQALQEVRCVEKSGKQLIEAARGYFTKIVADHGDHPEIGAFAIKHGLVTETVES